MTNDILGMVVGLILIDLLIKDSLHPGISYILVAAMVLWLVWSLIAFRKEKK